MKLFTRNNRNWHFNEGGRFLTLSYLSMSDGGYYRLWVQGLEVMCIKRPGRWPRIAFLYRRELLWPRA